MVVESPVESKPPVGMLAKKAAARVLNLCNTLEDMRDEFIPLLPTLDDEVVIEVRVGARAISVWAWVVECACDAEMFDRVEAARRGPKTAEFDDDDEAGKLKAAGQQAYLDGKAIRTVYRNAQIFNTFGQEFIAMHGKELQEKGFWIVALSAPDPAEAIEAFAEKKAVNPFFEVKDAQQEIDALKGKHEKAKNEFISAFRTVTRKAMGDWIRFTARVGILELKTNCPDPKLARVFQEMDDQLAEREEVLLIEDAEPALIYAWDKGWRTEKQMCDFTHLLPLEVRTTMLSLQDKGYFVEQEFQWKSKKSKGSRAKEWKRTQKPLPTIHVVAPTA